MRACGIHRAWSAFARARPTVLSFVVTGAGAPIMPAAGDPLQVARPRLPFQLPPLMTRGGETTRTQE